VEKEWSASLRSSRCTFWGSWEGERMAGGGVPTAAEAAAEEELVGDGLPGEEGGQALV
jgi:hypothetical protein